MRTLGAAQGNWMRGLRKLVAVVGLVFAGSSAFGAPVGSATGVDPEAVVRAGDTQQILVVGADLQLGDLIKTSAGGHAEILFHDGTKLVVGPGSTLTIEDYLLRDDGSAGKFAINALAGTFRFMSGNAPKDRYRIDTPAGTIGIRGTEFDFVVNGRQGTQVLMYDGATELCARDGNCSVISEVCELGDMTLDQVQSVGLTTALARSDRQALKARFVYGASQQPLQPSFRLKQTAKCLLPAFGVSVKLARAAAEKGPSAVVPGSRPAAAPDAKPVAPAAPVSTPVTPAPSAPEQDGECAGNSDHNPGRSQNCSR